MGSISAGIPGFREGVRNIHPRPPSPFMCIALEANCIKWKALRTSKDRRAEQRFFSDGWTAVAFSLAVAVDYRALQWQNIDSASFHGCCFFSAAVQCAAHPEPNGVQTNLKAEEPGIRIGREKRIQFQSPPPQAPLMRKPPSPADPTRSRNSALLQALDILRQRHEEK
ncbi:hypothetical protein C1H46_020558 [Malus baccata]|uniref:Uncharacterized protein n=1 Tax=Malus baccata TaxID=106549 RepID=A0A540M542_MALBA|nr:hypothetical protein C1H46_020558 [Malus baccata]